MNGFLESFGPNTGVVSLGHLNCGPETMKDHGNLYSVPPSLSLTDGLKRVDRSLVRPGPWTQGKIYF